MLYKIGKSEITRDKQTYCIPVRICHHVERKQKNIVESRLMLIRNMNHLQLWTSVGRYYVWPANAYSCTITTFFTRKYRDSAQGKYIHYVRILFQTCFYKYLITTISFVRYVVR